MNVIKHKRGDTLLWSVQTDEDLDDYGIQIQFRSSNDAILADVSIGNGIAIVDARNYTILVDAQITAQWPISLANFDIEYTKSSVVRSTDTWQLKILPDITR